MEPVTANMHTSALNYGKLFFDVYCGKRSSAVVVDVGSQNINGSLKTICPSTFHYVGVDFVSGNEVDIVLDDPYRLPFEDNTIDIVLCSSVFEHTQFFWLLFLEILRVLKPEGLFYLNVPSNGEIHRYPVDCWRLYPDSGHALVAWGERNGFAPILLESFTGAQIEDQWNDFVAVFAKHRSSANEYQSRILNHIDRFFNGFIAGAPEELCKTSLTEDGLRLRSKAEEGSRLESALVERVEQIAALNQMLTDKENQIFALNQAVAERNGRIAGLTEAVTAWDGQIVRLLAERDEQLAALNLALAEQDDRIAALNKAIWQRDAQMGDLEKTRQQFLETLCAIQRSSSWRITAPYRTVGNVAKRVVRPVTHSGILLKAIAGTLLLPSAVAYYGGIAGTFKAYRAGSGFFAKLIEDQTVVRERLLRRRRLIRRPALIGFSLAARILQAGSISRAFGNAVRVFRSEGIGGVRIGLMASAPGLAPPPIVVGSAPSTRSGADTAALLDPRRILVADYRVPMEDVSAGERATVGILRDLCALGFEVVFLPKDMAPSPQYEDALRKIGVTTINASQGYPSAQSYIRRHGGVFAAFYLIRVDVAEEMLGIIREVAPQARVIFHAPDVYFLRESREAKLTGCTERMAQAEATRERELAVIRRSDHTVIVSPAELPVLRDLVQDAKISVFPVLYAPIIPRIAAFGSRNGIFFLGGFAHGPNVDAVLWFVPEIWPLVRKKLPEAVFYIVGAEIPESVRALGSQPGVRVLGYVEQLGPLLDFMRVGVAPLRFGAGIKGKIAITMGAGVPCVCTEIATEGMGIQDGVHALVADDPQPFADAVASLFTDEILWDRLSRQGQTLVQDRFGDTANRTSLLKALDEARVLPLSLYCDYYKTAPPAPIPTWDTDTPVDVSIIVPVYNKWELTRACLTSVLQTSAGCGVIYEVILADDGSSDDTLSAGLLFPGIRIVKTPTNLGFLRNCNNAARHARGRYILLLNNDTVVLPGWLEALYRTIESDPSVAIVGSKLLYPDGVIQEAGAVLFSDGTAANLGRGSYRDAPVFNVQRQVDYISGASILVRKSFWDAVDGFDERYKNAYCEDSDLAMMARQQALRVVYEPKSEVVHFEHRSYADQDSSQTASLQQYNISVLVDKWQDIFAKDHLPRCEWQIAASRAERSAPKGARARRRLGKLNILYFTPFPSHPSSHGNQATIQQFARRFQSLGHRVHFALLRSGMYSEQDEQDMREAWDTLDILPNTLSLGADGAPIPFDGWYEAGLGEHIRVLCSQYDIDLVFCSYVFQSKLLEFVPDYVLKVIDTHDKMGNRYDMLRQHGQPLEFFSCSPEEEGAYLRRANIVVARREEEARYFDAVSGQNSAIVIPHVEDPSYIEKDFTTLKHVGVVASANRINLAIVCELLESLKRRLGSRECPFTVHVAGQVKDMVSSLPSEQAAIFNHPWVRLHGFVPDIGSFYRDMDCIVSPVTMGTGINVKTVQAMAYGMPLLTTAWGSKGIETGEPMHNHPDLDTLAVTLLHLVDTPDELARLAQMSRTRYQVFFDSSISGIREMFERSR